MVIGAEIKDGDKQVSFALAGCNVLEEKEDKKQKQLVVPFWCIRQAAEPIKANVVQEDISGTVTVSTGAGQKTLQVTITVPCWTNTNVIEAGTEILHSGEKFNDRC